MKVLFVHDHRFLRTGNEYYSQGGLPKSVWNRYLNYFDEVIVLGRKLNVHYDKEKLTLSSRNNVSFELLDYLESPINAYRYKSRVIKDIKNVIKKHSIRAVIARLPSQLGYAVIDVCKELNIPYVVEAVGCPYDAVINYKFTPWYNYKNFIVKILAPLSYRKMQNYVKGAKYVIYVTKYFLQSRYPAGSKSITSYASNVELPDFDKEILNKHVSLLTEEKEELKLGMIGNVDVLYKGYDVALRALSLIKDKIPQFKLYLVGGGEGDEVKKIAGKLGLTDNLVLVGKLESGTKIFNFLDGLDLYLHPSRQEGLPRSLIEAMGRGCPCLASSTAGIPELLPDEFLHKTGNYNMLSTQILDIFNSKEKQINIAKINFRKAKDYNIDILTQRRNEFLKSFYEYVNTFER